MVASSIVILGVLSTGLAYVLYFRLIGDVGATTASAVNYVVPVFAVLISVILLGGLVVLVGVAYAENRVKELRRGPGELPPTKNGPISVKEAR